MSILGEYKSRTKRKIEILQEMDKCINCGKDSIYTKDKHIDYRLYYIEGAGQLCYNCYSIIYEINKE